jgi:hypothetical protein
VEKIERSIRPGKDCATTNHSSIPFLSILSFLSKMTLNADLRAGWFKVDFKIEWFYEYLSNELHQEIEFVQDWRRSGFEDYIEKSFEEFVLWSVFQHKQRQDTDYELYNNDCFGFLTDRANDYIEKYARYMKWINHDEDEDESDTPNESEEDPTAPNETA